MEKLILTCTRPDFIWSIEFAASGDGDLVVIRYNYDKSFAKFIKKLGYMVWEPYILHAWVANKHTHIEIFYLINKKFPEWECIDKRR